MIGSIGPNQSARKPRARKKLRALGSGGREDEMNEVDVEFNGIHNKINKYKLFDML